MPATAMPRPPLARSSSGTSLAMIARTSCAQRARARPAAAGRREVALGLAHRARPAATCGSPAPRRPGRPRARCCRRRCRSPACGSPPAARALVAPRKVSRASSSPGDRARVDAEALAQLGAELLAVLGVAHGARGHGHDALGAVPFDRLAVVRAARAQHALHRGVGQPAAARRRPRRAGSRSCAGRARVEPSRPATSATSRRVELVPRSTTAIRVGRAASTVAVAYVGELARNRQADGASAPAADASDLAEVVLRDHDGQRGPPRRRPGRSGPAAARLPPPLRLNVLPRARGAVASRPGQVRRGGREPRGDRPGHARAGGRLPAQAGGRGARDPHRPWARELQARRREDGDARRAARPARWCSSGLQPASRERACARAGPSATPPSSAACWWSRPGRGRLDAPVRGRQRHPAERRGSGSRAARPPRTG